jgi:hypothetical protein
LSCSIQYRVDQDLDEIRSFWGDVVTVDRGVIRLQRKSNSLQLAGRTWRSPHGVLTLAVCDTLLHARVQAWMDRIRHEWRLVDFDTLSGA